MKRNNLYFCLIVMAFMFLSCTKQSYNMSTKINRDGSCTRSISTQTCDSAFLCGDTTANPFPFELNSDWHIECYNEHQKLSWPIANYKASSILTIMASRHFTSVEAMNQHFHYDRGLWSVCKPSIRFQKQFRWFYTYYTFTETYPQFSISTPIPSDRYLSSEELKIWFQGDEVVFQGNNGLELYDQLDKIESKVNLWYNHNMFVENYAAIERLLPDHPFQSRFKEARDSIFQQNQAYYDIFSSKFPEMLDNYYKTDYFSQHAQLINDNDDPELTRKLDSLDLYGITFQYELIMPGDVLSANTQQQDANRLIWQLDAYRFLPQDYVITAHSRKANLWAFILTALLFSLVLYYVKRK